MNAILFKHFNVIFNLSKAFHHHGTGVIDIEKVSLCHTQDKLNFIVMESFFIHFYKQFSFLILFSLVFSFVKRRKRRKTWNGHIMAKQNIILLSILFFRVEVSYTFFLLILYHFLRLLKAGIIEKENWKERKILYMKSINKTRGIVFSFLRHSFIWKIVKW